MNALLSDLDTVSCPCISAQRTKRGSNIQSPAKIPSPFSRHLDLPLSLQDWSPGGVKLLKTPTLRKHAKVWACRRVVLNPVFAVLPDDPPGTAASRPSQNILSQRQAMDHTFGWSGEKFAQSDADIIPDGFDIPIRLQPQLKTVESSALVASTGGPSGVESVTPKSIPVRGRGLILDHRRKFSRSPPRLPGRTVIAAP